MTKVLNIINNIISNNKKKYNYTFDGNGQSSNKRVITEGPSGLCIGIILTIELTTCIHPSSLSAIACNFNSAGGGSCSLNIISI